MKTDAELKQGVETEPLLEPGATMRNELAVNDRLRQEAAVVDRFLDCPDEDTFTDLFNTFNSQLIAFYRARGCEPALAEDLTQDVMLKVYRKAAQVRHRKLFRVWLFKVARHVLCSQLGKQARKVKTVDLEHVADRLGTWNNNKHGGTPAFEFLQWMALLKSDEREMMKLRFIEAWEYHEIAAKQAVPTGTVQWRVFNAKKKLAPHLATLRNTVRNAA